MDVCLARGELAACATATFGALTQWWHHQHLVFFLKYLMNVMVRDKPSSVILQMERQVRSVVRDLCMAATCGRLTCVVSVPYFQRYLVAKHLRNVSDDIVAAGIVDDSAAAARSGSAYVEPVECVGRACSVHPFV